MTPQDYLRQAHITPALLRECFVHEWGDTWYFSANGKQGKIHRTIKDAQDHDIPERWTLYWLNNPIYDPTQPADAQWLVKSAESPDKAAKVWQCIGHNPTLWALGTHESNGLLANVMARVDRTHVGQWRWMSKDHFGIEPSRELAMNAAEKAISISAQETT